MRKGSCASHFRDVSNFFKVSYMENSSQIKILDMNVLLLAVVVLLSLSLRNMMITFVVLHRGHM